MGAVGGSRRTMLRKQGVIGIAVLLIGRGGLINGWRP